MAMGDGRRGVSGSACVDGSMVAVRDAIDVQEQPTSDLHTTFPSGPTWSVPAAPIFRLRPRPCTPVVKTSSLFDATNAATSKCRAVSASSFSPDPACTPMRITAVRIASFASPSSTGVLDGPALPATTGLR